MDKTCKIYYYTGTGNSLAVAKRLQTALNAESLTAVTDELVKTKPHIECDKAVVIFPSYAYNMPMLVKKFFKASSFKVGHLTAIVTCGSKPGGTLNTAKKLLKKKNQALHLGLKIQTVENYVHLFGFPKEPKLSARLVQQEELTEKAAELIINNETNKLSSFHPSKLISVLFNFVKGLFPKFYRIKKTCTKCGYCQKICPTAAIKMTEKGPRFTARKCDHCQSCLNLCPQKSIKYARITPKSARYCHPDVKPSEFIKR